MKYRRERYAQTAPETRRKIRRDGRSAERYCKRRTGIIKILLFSTQSEIYSLFLYFLYYLHHMSLISSHLILPSFPDYELIDSGNGMKFERYGDFKIARPESQALWDRKLKDWDWDAYFDKSGGGQGKWAKTPADIRDWIMNYNDLSWQCRWSPYRHVGVFPEQAMHWDWMRSVLRTQMQSAKCKVQNNGTDDNLKNPEL